MGGRTREGTEKSMGVRRTQRGWEVKVCSPGAGCVEKERSLYAAGRKEGVVTG